MTPSELRALVAAMTPGPWDYESHKHGESMMYEIAPVLDAHGRLDWSQEVCATADDSASNAAGICALRNMAPALVELWEAVEAYRVSRESSVGPSIEAAHAALLAAAKRVGEQA